MNAVNTEAFLKIVAEDKPIDKKKQAGQYIGVQFPTLNTSRKYDADGLSALMFLANRKSKKYGIDHLDSDVLRQVVSQAVRATATIQGWKPGTPGLN